MKKNGLVILIILLAVMAAAYFGYGVLSERYSPDGEKQAQMNGTVPETQAPSETGEPAATAAPAEAAETTPAEAETEKKTAAPDFTVLDNDGNAVRLSDFFGKPVIINFWATWCGPCKSELPAFDEAYRTYGDRISFLMVDLTDGVRDTVGGARRFVSENSYGFPVFYDTESDAARAYGIYSIPLTVLVNADGSVAGYRVGAMDKSILWQYIDGLLKEVPKA